MLKLAEVPKFIVEMKESEYVQKRRYPKLMEHYRALQTSYKEAKTREEQLDIMQEDDSLAHVFEADRIALYEQIMEYAKSIGGQRVFDIGCAYGHQSEVFVDTDIDYVGVVDMDANFFNQDTFTYMIGRYPMALDTKLGDVGVSVLCLTWNCYLIEGEKTLHEQCAALKRDFKDCILYTTTDKLPVIQEYFECTIKIGENLYHLKNAS